MGKKLKPKNLLAKLLLLKTYNANARCCNGPAEFPPCHWVVSNHVFDAIIESINTECPRDRHTFEEYQEQQTETTDRIRIKDLEHVHTTLMDQ